MQCIVNLEDDLNLHELDIQSASHLSEDHSYFTLDDVQAAAPIVDAHNVRTEGTRIHEKVSQGTDLYMVNQTSYKPLAALRKGKLEHYRSSDFMTNVSRFELGYSAKRAMPDGECSPNDLQVHTIS